MNYSDCWQKYNFELLNVAYLRFSSLHEYHDVISPYSRMYLITKGEGMLIMGNRQIKLEAGFLYLVPSFIHCTYLFNEGLEHIYIHFRALTDGGLTLYNLYSFRQKTEAVELSEMLFRRLLEINPGLELPHHDPKIYQNKPWMNKKPNWSAVSQKLESEAILQMLLSGFITGVSNINLAPNMKYNLHQILVYIQNNLQNEIKVEELANMACLSNDHFTRIFKSVMGIPPGEYVIRKRIEKSQYLLLSTDFSINRIIEQTNFKSTAYFARMFKKYVFSTPAVYRKHSG
jgi:AraC family transcriptional regulator